MSRERRPVRTGAVELLRKYKILGTSVKFTPVPISLFDNMFVKLGKPSRKNKAHHIHIDNHDVWSLDYTLATIIHPALIRLRERVPHFGYPTPYYETEAYPEFSSQGSFEEILDRDAESKYYEALWMEKLQKMIDAFGMIVDEADDYDKIAHHHDDKDKRTEWYRKIDEGLNLFAKNYQGLWD